MAEEIASRESSMAPRSDSSASRLWGGMHPVDPPRPLGAVMSLRGRVSSKAHTIVLQPSRLGTVERKGLFLGKSGVMVVDDQWTGLGFWGQIESSDDHPRWV